MAARWGAGEEILSACNMDFFSTNALNEAVILHGCLSSESMASLELETGEALGALNSCLDPSLLSIFEDPQTGENKAVLDDENETTLLTALTEILDNVDDENLSPFDTLPDSDLLSGHKGREQSPLRKLLCLSHAPLEKEMYCNTQHFSIGKSLPRAHMSVQRSDGEEEEDREAFSLSLSPNSHASSPEQGLLGWCDLPLALEQHMEAEVENGEGLSVSLGELVRHMHPYCMAVCLENGEEQLLPEEGILLEVVDQGEHGETIFAITDMGLPLSISQPNPPVPGIEDLSGVGPMVPAEVSQVDFLQSLESANDNDDVVDEPAEVIPTANQRCEVIGSRLKQEIMGKCPSRRKKNKKNKDKCSTVEVTSEPAPADGRVLRSSSNKRAPLEPLPRKPIKEKAKHERKNNIKELFTSAISTAAAPKPKVKVLRPTKTKRTQPRTEVIALTLPTHPSVKVIPGSHPVLNVKSPGRIAINVNATPEKVSQPSAACQKPCGPPASAAIPTATQTTAVTKATSTTFSTAPQGLMPCKAPTSVPSQMMAPPSSATSASPNQQIPQPVEPAAIEPKPRPLSLEQYRLLRRQNKLAPVGRKEDQSTKWPSLPEPPTELPPIPCLPTPFPRDPRRTQPAPMKNEAMEVKAPWQPLGPGAPPTPEALLVPPAYMKSSKCSSPTKVAGPNAALTTSPRQAFSPVAASQPQPALIAVPAFLSGEIVAPLPQTSSTRTLLVELSVPSTPLLNIQHSALKTVIVTKSKSSVGASSKTTTNVHRPTQITADLSAGSSPAAATLPERALNPTTVAFSVQKPTPAALPKVGASPQETVAAFLQPKYSSVTAMTPLTQASNPLLMCTPTQKAPKATQELIKAFTGEIGIEAADLTSLLEQFEETQAKEEQCVLEVSGRAAAVESSSVEQLCERTALERVKAHDLSNTAGLTPPATPPHQMWKPLASVALLGKNHALEALKPSSSMAIQIDPRPLPSNKLRYKPPCCPVTATLDPVAVSLAFFDHDYCLPLKEPVAVLGEPGKRWNVKQQTAITIKTVELLNGTRASQMIPATSPQPLAPSLGVIPQQALIGSQFLDVRPESPCSLLETPEASPTRLEELACPVERFPKNERSYRGYNTNCSTRPTSGPREGNQGRARKRFPRSSSPCSSGSECSSQSKSCSPPRKRYRPHRPESCSSASSCSSRCSSCSSSRSSSPPSRSPTRMRRYSYSSSRSGSWSTSRSRSPLRQAWGRSSSSSRRRSPSLRPGYRPVSKENTEEVKRLKEKAIEERRVVYVGRIRGTMTRKELKDRFSLYGEIEECTLHFRDHGDNYGFVTYYDTTDAFTAIENGGKLRKPDELPFDLCFGGRRQFCKTSYADLDSNREYDPSPAKGKFDALDFDTLLKQAQKSQKR